MSKADDIKELERYLFTYSKIPSKIKMKQDFYDYLVAQNNQVTQIIHQLDEDNQPLSTLFGLKIEIDNEIEEDYKVVF